MKIPTTCVADDSLFGPLTRKAKDSEVRSDDVEPRPSSQRLGMVAVGAANLAQGEGKFL